MYFVYILVCRESGRSYVGQTDNLLRRFQAHLEGSTRTTREKIVAPFVVYWEAHPTRSAAMRRERYFKAGSGHRVKRQLINATLAVS
jgi:putative endonuclease